MEGDQNPGLLVEGTTLRQSPNAIFRYTIVYKLYGLFIYSTSYVCIYVNICIGAKGLLFLLFLLAADFNGVLNQ
jgi:hypothetical protein